MSYLKNLFNDSEKNDLRTDDNIRRMELVKEMITQLVVY